VLVEEVVAESREEEEATDRRAALWEVPSEDWLSQRLFRVRFSTPKGSGRFKLTLHYSNPEQFQISANDPLGRSLWSLYVADSEALLLEHRNKRACSFDEELDLSSLYLGSFPVRSLPNLLLGRLPAAPESLASWQGQGVVLKFEDREARRWTVSLSPEVKGPATREPVAGRGISAWSVEEPSSALRAELRRDEDWWVLLDRHQDLELRWRQIVAEPLAGPLVIPQPPSRYEQGDCLVRSP